MYNSASSCTWLETYPCALYFHRNLCFYIISHTDISSTDISPTDISPPDISQASDASPIVTFQQLNFPRLIIAKTHLCVDPFGR